MRKVKVLHIEIDGHLGGIESFLFNLFNQIDRDKVQFDFVTRAENPAYATKLKLLGTTIYQVPSYRNIIAYMRRLDAIIGNGYDVVHIHKNSAAVILPFLVARRHNNVRVFAHSHNTHPSIGGVTQVLHELNKNILWNYSDEHFACSKIAGEWLYGTGRKFTVINNGINTRNYRYDPMRGLKKREELGISNDMFVIGNVGRFTDQKNQIRLVQIFEELLQVHKNIILVLVGDGEQKKSVENYCSQKALTKQVMFLGVRNDIADLMMMMDAFVMPSKYEGLPIVAIEAQSAGLPIYLSDTISGETDITNSAHWFSLKDSSKAIAEMICIKRTTTQERIEKNGKVIAAGFDMSETAKYLCRRYLNE